MSRTAVHFSPQALAAQARWAVTRGQLWELPSRTDGQAHRLLCGDSRDPACVAPLLDGASGSTLLFDPDWSRYEAPDGDYTTVLAFADGQRAADVIRLFGPPAWVFVWDCVTSWVTRRRPLKRTKLCLWYGDPTTYNLNGWRLPWDAPRQAKIVHNTRGDYSYRPNPKGRQLCDLFQKPLPQLHAAVGHAHAKPVEWLAMLIGNCSSGGVYDPYSGSGAGLLACETVGGRPCRAVEIEPHFVALTLQRYEDTFGITPRLSESAAIYAA